MTVMHPIRRIIAASVFGATFIGVATASLVARVAPAFAEPAVPRSPNKEEAAPPSLVVFFDKGSSTLRRKDRAILDRASRAYNEGRPIVMMLTGTSDRVGDAQANLALSQRRATAVLRGLLDRGIPADRFQVLAKGQTELPVPTNAGVPEVKNRRVEISWR